jgi:hypothetical protein
LFQLRQQSIVFEPPTRLLEHHAPDHHQWPRTTAWSFALSPAAAANAPRQPRDAVETAAISEKSAKQHTKRNEDDSGFQDLASILFSPELISSTS